MTSRRVDQRKSFEVNRYDVSYSMKQIVTGLSRQRADMNIGSRFAADVRSGMRGL